jgi:hypothetical protein
MSAQFVEIVRVPILGWAARPSSDTTIGDLGRACQDLNLTVLLLENEVHLALADPNDAPPEPEVLAACLFGDAGMTIEETPVHPAIANLEARARS